jgi:hypothetical protein
MAYKVWIVHSVKAACGSTAKDTATDHQALFKESIATTSLLLENINNTI